MRNLTIGQKKFISENTICDVYSDFTFEAYHSTFGGLVVKKNETSDEYSLTQDGKILLESSSRSDILDGYVDAMLGMSDVNLEN